MRLIIAILLIGLTASAQDISFRRKRPAAAAGISVVDVRRGSAVWSLTASTSDPMAATTGNAIAVYCGAVHRSDHGVTVSDTAGNSYSKITATYNESVSLYGAWFLATNITGHASNTITCTSTASGETAVVAYHISGVATASAVDTYTSGDWDYDSVMTSTAFSTSQPSTIALYGLRVVPDSSTFTPQSGYTIPDNGTTSDNMSSTQYQIFTATQSNITAAMTVDSSKWVSAVVMVLKGQ